MVSILTVFKGMPDTKATKSMGQISQTCLEWVTATTIQFPVFTVSSVHLLYCLPQ